MTSYLSQEVELSKRHDEILCQRASLLQKMGVNLENAKSTSKFNSEASCAARVRNEALLNDITVAQERLNEKVLSQPHPDVVTLETCYWASVEESIPKWELFLLGRTQSPFIHQAAMQREKNKPKDTAKPQCKDLPPSGVNSSSPHKQRKPMNLSVAT